jgi:hypothetical protein
MYDNAFRGNVAWTSHRLALTRSHLLTLLQCTSIAVAGMRSAVPTSPHAAPPLQRGGRALDDKLQHGGGGGCGCGGLQLMREMSGGEMSGHVMRGDITWGDDVCGRWTRCVVSRLQS